MTGIDLAVIGGGITGLAAAWEAATAGATVAIVEPGEPGGKVRSRPFDGGLLDEGADAFLARVPEGVELCEQIGLGGDLVTPAARRAYVWSRGELRPLPEAQVLGVPTDLDELAASGIVSSEGIDRARRDLSEPLVAPQRDVTIGDLVRERLGDEVHDRLVDPLVGGINAGDCDRLSLAATVPQLDAAARSGASSLIEACVQQRAAASDPSAPVFFAPQGGMGALVDRLVERLVERGAAFVGGRAQGIATSGAGWRLESEDEAVEAGRVLVATPADVAAELVRPHAARAATLLAAIPYASVVLVSLAVPREAVARELDASGYLVPRVEDRLLTACSWVSSKWAHLGGAGGEVWLRASAGRDGDDRALALDDDAARRRLADRPGRHHGAAR